MKEILTKIIVPILLITACQMVELSSDPYGNKLETVVVSGPEFRAQVEAFGAAGRCTRGAGQGAHEGAGQGVHESDCRAGTGSQGVLTKTALAAEKSVVWSAGDQVAIFQGKSAADRYKVKEDGVGKTSATFEIVAKSESSDAADLQANVAIYPYEDNLVCTEVVSEGVSTKAETGTTTGAIAAYQITGVTIPATQTYVADSFADDAFPMAAITSDIDDHDLNFKNLCGVLKLQLKGTAKVKTIELRGNNNEPLSGEATVTLYPDGSTPTIEMSADASKAITLDCGEGIQLNETEATAFLIAIPPTAFEEGFTIVIADIQGGKAQIETSKTNTIGRSYIHTMPTIVVGINNIVPKSKDESIKILCFGSSWFLNTWWYLNKITADLGINAEIHGYYVGHSCFDEWIAMYNNDLSPFSGSESTRGSYRYISVNGEEYTSSKRITDGEYGNQEYRDDWYNDLTAGDWDIIAFQQGAHQSPKWEYWQNGDELISLIRKHAGPETVIAFNNTWTPSITSSYLPGDTDGKCSKTLEGQILWQTMNNDNCKRFINLTGLNTISPNGAMVYTLRRDSMINIDGDDLCYDGLHPNHGLPMFALASVFYETYIAPFYGISINECTWLPESSDKRGPFNNSVFRPVSQLQKERIYQYVRMSLDNRFGFNEPLPPVEDTDWTKVQGIEVMNTMPQENGYASSTSGLVTEYSGYDWSKYDVRVTCRYGSNALMYAGCFWGENDTYLGGFWKSTGTAKIFNQVILTDEDLPEGVSWSDVVKIGLSSQENESFGFRYSTLEIRPKEVDEDLDLYKPFIEMGAIRKAGDFAVNYYGKKYYRTPRYMRPLGSSISVTSLQECEVRLSQYDSDYKFIGLIEFASVKPDKLIEFDLNDTCQYVRLTIRKNSALTEFECPDIYVNNVEGKEYREVRSEDEGYQKLIIPIMVDNEFLPDYGVLALPESYSNTGEPTRLIIFCHGAAVNYPTSVSRFNETDCKPEYWLKEGYAVMDIEGNPFDNSNEHFYIPQARQAYEAAYNWIINTYNISTDGVFLGGRSMGGGMCFELLQSDIPVIAACPVVPACNTLWCWNYCNATRKEFCTSKMGFTGTKPTWTSNKKLTDEEYKYLYDNFDQLLKYAPFWRAIENLPDKDELFSVARVSANVTYDEGETELFSTLRYKVDSPVKIYTCYEDATVPYQRNALLMYNMLQNAGVESELYLVHTDASNGHRFELQDSNAYTKVTTPDGEIIQAPVVYIDMLKFWRKYE